VTAKLDPLTQEQLTHAPLTIVICVDHAATTGGQAKVAADSAIGLKRQGHRPILFAASGPVAPELEAAGVEVICLGQNDLHRNASKLAAAVQGIWNAEAAKALGDLLARLPRDCTIIHMHGWATALSAATAAPIRASRLPAICTFHEYFLFCPNGGFYNYNEQAICHLTPLSASCLATNCSPWSHTRKLWQSARLATARYVARLQDVFSDAITLSQTQSDIIAPRLPKHIRLHRLSNPVAVDDLGQKPDPTAGDILYVGRISPEKGPFLFCEAARRIGLKPTLIGDGPRIQQLAEQYPEAKLLGWKSGQELRDLMRGARALVFPSLWYEGQPLTVLEAKAMGVPVIVADTCAGRDEVEDGVTGLWFKGGDADDLAHALSEMRDDARVAAMSEASYRAYWADPLTLERHANGLLSIYHDMLDARRSPLLQRTRKHAAAEIHATAPH